MPDTQKAFGILLSLFNKKLNGFTSLRKTLDDNVHSVTSASLPSSISTTFHLALWTQVTVTLFSFLDYTLHSTIKKTILFPLLGVIFHSIP